MKKFLVTILAFLFLISSGGAMVNLHYCMGKLKGWDLTYTTQNTCGNCGMEKVNKGCCHDEQKKLQLDIDQQLRVADFQFCTNSGSVVIPDFTILLSGYILAVVIPTEHLLTPPWPGKVSIFARHHNFRI